MGVRNRKPFEESGVPGLRTGFTPAKSVDSLFFR